MSASHDWRDSVRLGADLALLGVLMTMACLPVLTAGAAVGTASAALDRLLTVGRWSTAAECWADFRTRLVPGLYAGPLVLAAAWLLAIDVAALRRGSVPGGPAMIAAVLLAAAVGVGFAALVAGLAGPSHAHAVRRAAALAAVRPRALAATTGVVVVVAALAALVHPAVLPVLAGFALFAVHAVLVRVAAFMPGFHSPALLTIEPAAPQPAPTRPPWGKPPP
ncbi:hypothetical protein M1L60_10640 [Actinoplanes sp. TRM 88003]|uniref:DUF624 domain-containing protein n=1 Tax=Paractinoplanes aksuensis TaxID=2939490 RepID=A0ABT1DJS7_9ACTN|nr:hypothetical protein [Actinoplanes aksuensis]MCO8271050.1 hypothetical protein [Actinoplanes aksuensis]